MKKLILVLLTILPLSFVVAANSLKPEPDEEEKHAKLLELLQSRKFVLNAHTAYDRYGQMVFVTPTTNFVALDSAHAVMQLALNNGNFGYNGLGGITLDGRLSQFKLKDRGVGKGAFIKMTVFGSFPATLFMEIDSKGRAIVSWTGIHGGKLRFKGDITALGETFIYEGYKSY